MISAEHYQATRGSRKLTEALKLISTARSCLALLEPATKTALGVERDEDALEGIARRLNEMRVRLGYVRTDLPRAAPSTASPAPVPAPSLPQLTARAPADPTFKPAVVVRPPPARKP